MHELSKFGWCRKLSDPTVIERLDADVQGGTKPHFNGISRTLGDYHSGSLCYLSVASRETSSHRDLMLSFSYFTNNLESM